MQTKIIEEVLKDIGKELIKIPLIESDTKLISKLEVRAEYIKEFKTILRKPLTKLAEKYEKEIKKCESVWFRKYRTAKEDYNKSQKKLKEEHKETQKWIDNWNKLNKQFSRLMKENIKKYEKFAEWLEEFKEKNDNTINDFNFTNQTIKMRDKNYKKNSDYTYNESAIIMAKAQNKLIKSKIKELKRK